MENGGSLRLGHGNSSHVAGRTLLEAEDGVTGGCSVPAGAMQPWRTLAREGEDRLAHSGWTEAVRTKIWPCDSPHQSITDRTYFRHKARGCSRSLSAGPREAMSAKGQASSIMKAASSSRTGKSVSVMTAIWGRQTEVIWKHCRQGTSPVESSCGSCPGASARPALVRVLSSQEWLGRVSSSNVPPRVTGDLLPHLPALF